jgi:hypothetical protein
MNPTIVAQDQGITFEAMDVLPRHIEAALLELGRYAYGDPSLERALGKAKAGLARGEYWTDRQQVFHIESATTPDKVYSVDVLGHCSCPAHSRCWHATAREIMVYATSLASNEAWDHVRAQGGCHIWRTTTGYLACFDGQVIMHATQPHDARAALLDYQVGLLEHEQVDTVVPTHDLRISSVNGISGAVLSALIDAGLPVPTCDVVAERRARMAQAAVVRIVVERAA